MNELYRDYSLAIQNEIIHILDKEAETGIHLQKKKDLRICKKIRVTLYLLRNKASK